MEIIQCLKTVIIFGADEEPYSSGVGKLIFAPGTVQNTSVAPAKFTAASLLELEIILVLASVLAPPFKVPKPTSKLLVPFSKIQQYVVLPPPMPAEKVSKPVIEPVSLIGVMS